MSDKQHADDQQLPTPLYVRVIRGLIALIAVAGMVYLAGGHQYFFLRRTPPTVEQTTVESALDADPLTIPLTIFILTGDEATGSQRDEQDIERLVQNANAIWQQANLNLAVTAIHRLPVSHQDLQTFSQTPHQFVTSANNYNPATINIFLARTLQGINGIAFGGTNSLAVADYTSVFDFRTLAHEIGHLLSLDHIPGDQNRLMFRGANGTNLSLEEIMHARQTAQQFEPQPPF